MNLQGTIAWEVASNLWGTTNTSSTPPHS
jgi:hypothetical protein